MVTTNERSFIVASISAVATICAPAPSSTQGQNVSGGAGSAWPDDGQHRGEEDDRERKAEQKTHMGRADRAERRRELPLHGVARGLARGGQQRERNPEQAREHECLAVRKSGGFEHAGLAVRAPFGDLAVLVVDQQEQVEVADRRDSRRSASSRPRAIRRCGPASPPRPTARRTCRCWCPRPRRCRARSACARDRGSTTISEWCAWRLPARGRGPIRRVS